MNIKADKEKNTLNGKVKEQVTGILIPKQWRFNFSNPLRFRGTATLYGACLFDNEVLDLEDKVKVDLDNIPKEAMFNKISYSDLLEALKDFFLRSFEGEFNPASIKEKEGGSVEL